MLEKNERAIIFVFCVLSFFYGCVSPEDEIMGVWKAVSGEEDIYFTFEENNELNVNNQIFMKYSITEDHKIIWGGEDPVPFSIKNNTLRIMHDSVVLTYKRIK